MQVSEVGKYAVPAQFTTLMLYILQGVYRRYDLAIPKPVLIFLAAVNLVFAVWSAYRIQRQKQECKTAGRRVKGSLLTAAIAAGLFVFILFH